MRSAAWLLITAVPALAHADGSTLVGDDVSPSLVVASSDKASITFGGLLQVHVAPYVGDDSLLTNDDPASRAGLRLRRARFGALATLPSHVEVLLVMNPLESDTETGSISEARISYTKQKWARLSIGADKTPFTRGELVSSSALLSIERPLGIQTLVPQRRLGITVEGSGESVGYIAGVMNATEGYEPGNQFSGLLYVARGEVAVLGRRTGKPTDDLTVITSVGGYYEDGPASRVVAASADVAVRGWGASLVVEALCDRRMPKEMPVLSPDLAGDITRCDGYVEAGYELKKLVGTVDVQPVARVEIFDDNRDLDDAGDVLLVSGGANARVNANLRAQLSYLGRIERKSQSRANDAVIMSVQGQF